MELSSLIGHFKPVLPLLAMGLGEEANFLPLIIDLKYTGLQENANSTQRPLF